MVDTVGCVFFTIKPMRGSTCIHHLESEQPMRLDTGHLAEMVMRSSAVHITRHGIRFIPTIHTLRDGGMRGWTELECVQSGGGVGSLCSIPTAPGGTHSEVLPCSPSHVPRVSGRGMEEPQGLRDLLSSVPDEVAGCRGTGRDAGDRVVLPLARFYDITQCDLSSVGMSMVFVNSRSRLFAVHGMELSYLDYTVSGILIVVLVSCITQNIVYTLNEGAGRPARGDVCFLASMVSLALVVATTEGWSTHYLVTQEEVVAYWYMVAYCSARMAGVLGRAVGFASADRGSTVHRASVAYSQAMRDHYHNVLVTLLQMLATRIHLTISTPYTGGLAFLVGTRLFLKVYEAGDRCGAWEVVVLIADSILLQCMCVSGVLSQFESLDQGYAGMVVLVFSCISAGRVVHMVRLASPKQGGG